MSSLLITGATGFLGAQVLERLTLGSEVEVIHAVSRRTIPPEQSGSQIQWHEADLLNYAAVRALFDRIRPTYLLHLAWDVEHGRFWNAPSNLSWVGASLNLLKIFADRGGTRAVCAGTCAEYRWDDNPYDEFLTPAKPKTLYGSTKLAVCRVAQARAREQGYSFAWARLFHMYGRGEDRRRVFPAATSAFRANRRFVLQNGDGVRDWIDTRDAADALVCLLFSGVIGQVNIGSGEQISLRDALELIQSYLGQSGLIDILSVNTGSADPVLQVPVLNRLHEAVGWRAKIPFTSGLKSAMNYY